MRILWYCGTGAKFSVLKGLQGLGYVNVKIDYSYNRTDIEPGIVYKQSFAPDEMRSDKSPFTIYAGPLPSEQIVVPDVVGMTMDEALALLEGIGLSVSCGFNDSPQPGYEVGYCVEVMRFVPDGADREVLHLIIQYVLE